MQQVKSMNGPAKRRQQTPNISNPLDLAVKHHAAGRLSEAENLYQQILRAEPHQPVVLHLLDVIAFLRSLDQTPGWRDPE